MSVTDTTLKLDKVCRGCLSEEGVMTSVFESAIKPDVLKMFESCTSIQIKEDDGFPTHICSSCILRLHESYQFQQMCVQSDFTVRTFRNSTDVITDAKLLDSDGMHLNQEEKCAFKEESAHNKESDNLETCYECGVCSQQFHTIRNLKEHEFDSHVPDKVCSECGKRFESLDEVIQHTCLQDNKTGTKRHQCKECDKEYTSSHNLQIHMYSHSGIKPFSCEYCGKSFTKINSLNSHVSLHTGYLSFLCSECGKGFSTSTGLKRHKISHSGERPYKCKICPGSFAASGDLTVHMRSHTGEKPYLCPTCGKAFSRISHLNTHARTHTGEKPYKCLRCDRAFAQSGDLRSHERTHTGEKPYVCHVCKKRFIQSSGLASHMRTHTGEKSYRCLLCHKAFSQASSLARHRRCHSE